MPCGRRFHPLTPDRWDDVVDLFGPERGANSGCWCMGWRMPGPDWKAVPREAKRDRFCGEGYVGLAPVFRAAGFEEVARRSPTRPLMRLRVLHPAVDRKAAQPPLL